MRLRIAPPFAALVVRLRSAVLQVYELPSGHPWCAVYTPAGALVRVLVPMRC